MKQFTNIPYDPSHAVETIRSLANQWIAGVQRRLRRSDRHSEPPARSGFLPVHAESAAGSSGAIWPVVYFLTKSNKGYCQYFASAMGSMLAVSGSRPGWWRPRPRHDPGAEWTCRPAPAGSLRRAMRTAGSRRTSPATGGSPSSRRPCPSRATTSRSPVASRQSTAAPTPPPATSKPVPTQKPGNVNGVDPNSLRTPKAHASLPGAVVVSLAVLEVYRSSRRRGIALDAAASFTDRHLEAGGNPWGHLGALTVCSSRDPQGICGAARPGSTRGDRAWRARDGDRARRVQCRRGIGDRASAGAADPGAARSSRLRCGRGNLQAEQVVRDERTRQVALAEVAQQNRVRGFSVTCRPPRHATGAARRRPVRIRCIHRRRGRIPRSTGGDPHTSRCHRRNRS